MLVYTVYSVEEGPTCGLTFQSENFIAQNYPLCVGLSVILWQLLYRNTTWSYIYMSFCLFFMYIAYIYLFSLLSSQSRGAKG